MRAAGVSMNFANLPLLLGRRVGEVARHLGIFLGLQPNRTPHQPGVTLPPFRVKRPECDVDVLVHVLDASEGARCCCIFHIEGEISAGPKATLQAVRETLATLERLARDAGCDELRIIGRDWARMLPDYERSWRGKGLRKVL